jgi:cytosine/adenosine deaminase-related metal-dependent hydrolase
MKSLLLFVVACAICLPAGGQGTTQFDLVLAGGRVMDPETGLDAVQNVGISGGTIAAISSEDLNGKKVIDVSGLVVSPGFIDLHVHGVTNTEQEYQLHDGLTTALELEWGIGPLQAWYARRESHALINYGASASWPFERYRAFQRYRESAKALLETAREEEIGLLRTINEITPSYSATPSQTEREETLRNLGESLRAGGIGIGIPVGYLPQTDPAELYEVYAMAAAADALLFTHVRQPNLAGIQEALSNAALTGAPLHIVHLNSMALGKIELALKMLDDAKERGLRITSEVYPYTAASTTLESAMFDEGWQQRLGMGYEDLQWVATGERLTRETFDTYRQQGGVVIMHMMQPEWIQTGLSAAGVAIASDGMMYAPLAHPRTAGTFARVLGKYVREEQVLDLMTAVAKMTLIPASILEDMAPAMKRKGRLQIGADADITIFDPGTVRDRATFDGGLEFSEGVEYVLVGGVLALENGDTVPDVFAGQPVYGKHRQ